MKFHRAMGVGWMPIKDVQVQGVQNLVFLCGCHKWMTPYIFFFAIKYDFFFVFLYLFTLLFHCSFHCFCMTNKKNNHNLNKKDEGEQILKINLKMHHTQVSFICIKEVRNKLGIIKKSCRACWIRLAQLNHIL